MSRKIRNLVFEGGGVKGTAYCGALAELEKREILSGVKRVAGTSAGAITATLLAVGYGPEELTRVIKQVHFKDFFKGGDDAIEAGEDLISFIKGKSRAKKLFELLELHKEVEEDIERVIHDFGVCEGKFFLDWIGGLIKKKTGEEDITFEGLKDQSGSRELYLIATNLSRQTEEIFSHEHTPCVEIRKAVRMSMSFPLAFECVRYKDEEIMVDGGVSRNYPLALFDDRKYLDNNKDGEGSGDNKGKDHVFNNETLGLRLNSLGDPPPRKIDDIIDYVVALVEFAVTMANKERLHEKDRSRSVSIDTLGVSTLDFHLSEKEIQGLIESGRKGVEDYFKLRDNEGL